MIRWLCLRIALSYAERWTIEKALRERASRLENSAKESQHTGDIIWWKNATSDHEDTRALLKRVESCDD